MIIALSPGRLGGGGGGGERPGIHCLHAHASKCTQNPGTP